MLKVDIENGYTIFTDSEFGDSEVRFPLNAANMALNMINEYDKFSDNKSIRGL